MTAHRRLGIDVAVWDFTVEGVTSISIDVHKLGYANKGVIAYYALAKSKDLLPKESYAMKNPMEFFAVTGSIFLSGKSDFHDDSGSSWYSMYFLFFTNTFYQDCS